MRSWLPPSTKTQQDLFHGILPRDQVSNLCVTGLCAACPCRKALKIVDLPGLSRVVPLVSQSRLPGFAVYKHTANQDWDQGSVAMRLNGCKASGRAVFERFVSAITGMLPGCPNNKT